MQFRIESLYHPSQKVRTDEKNRLFYKKQIGSCKIFSRIYSNVRAVKLNQWFVLLLSVISLWNLNKTQKFLCSSNNVCTKFNVTANCCKIKKNIIQENTNKFAI